MIGTLLPREEIGRAEEKRRIIVTDRREIDVLSTDLEVKILYEHRRKFRVDEHRTAIRELSEACAKDQEGDLIAEMAPSGGSWILKQNHLYVARAKQELSKSRGIAARVKSRSTWARYGLLQRTLNQDIRDGKEYNGGIEFLIIPKTNIILRPGDAPAHIFFAYGSFYKLTEEEIKTIPHYEHIAEGAEINHDGFTLTYGNSIEKYNGKVIDPHKEESVKEAFEPISIKEGVRIKPEDFFIGASAQMVEIPAEYVGYLNGTDGDPSKPGKQWVHLNAPFIKLGFRAVVVSENEPLEEMIIREGGRMGELRLMRLSRKYERREGEQITRYEGQKDVRHGTGG